MINCPSSLDILASQTYVERDFFVWPKISLAIDLFYSARQRLYDRSSRLVKRVYKD